MENSRTKNSLINIFTGFFGQFFQLLISFINRIIFVHCLSQAYLGINGLFTNVLSMLSLAELGISSAISYALYEPLAKKDNSKVSSLMHMYAKAYRIIGVIVGVVGIIFIPFLKYIISDPGNIHENITLIYSLFLFNTVISYFYSYKSTLITADQKNYIISIISYCITFGQTIIQIIVLVFFKNFILYLIIQSIGTFLTNYFISWKANRMYPLLKEKNPPSLSAKDKHDLFKNIKALMITKISGVLVNSTDNIIISATKGLGLVSTGIASNYTLLINILNSILNQIFTGITASIGNLNASEDIQTKKHFFNVVNLLNYLLFSWCTVSFIFLSTDLVGLVFGNQYVLTIPIVIIIAINFYTVGMQSAVWTYKSTLGLFDYGKYLVLVTGIINIILSIILGQKIGLFGIFLATFISRLCTNIWYDPYAVLKHGLNMSFIEYVKKYFSFIVIILLQISLMEFIFLYNDSFIFKFICCIFIPNLINIFIFRNTDEFQYLLNKVNSLIKKLRGNLNG